MAREKSAEILVTDETRAVVEHYLQKQWARREKRAAQKAAEEKKRTEWDPGKGPKAVKK